MTAPLLRARDFARRLGVTEVTVYNLVRAGKVSAVLFSTRPGRQTVRFTEEAVQEFIRQHTREGR